MANALVQVRVDENLKQEAGKLFEQLGIDIPTAFRIFLKKSVQEGGLPFDMKVNEPYRASAGWQAVLEAGKQAAENGISQMTMEEINAEIALARQEKREGNS
jgi:DNA-damage-inducible protein J